MKVLTNLNLSQNELLNAVIQNLTTEPSSGKTGQIYYNTEDNQIYRYTTAGAWEAIKGSNQKIQVGTTGFGENAVINFKASTPLSVAANNTDNSITFTIANASTSQAGAVRLATTTEAAGTSEEIAVTPKGLKAVINGLSFNNQTITANGTAFGANDAVDFVSANDYLTILGNSTTKKVTLTVNLPSWIFGQVLYGGNATAVGTTCTVTPSSSLKEKKGITASTITLAQAATGTGTTFGYGQLEGVYFICNDKGTFANIAFEVGDWLISTGEGWSKVDNTDTVKSASLNGNIITPNESGVLVFTLDGAVKPVLTENLTPYKVLISDGNGKIAASTDVNTNQLKTLSGIKLTDDSGNPLTIQQQLDGMVTLATAQTITGKKTFTSPLTVNASDGKGGTTSIHGSYIEVSANEGNLTTATAQYKILIEPFNSELALEKTNVATGEITDRWTYTLPEESGTIALTKNTAGKKVFTLSSAATSGNNINIDGVKTSYAIPHNLNADVQVQVYEKIDQTYEAILVDAVLTTDNTTTLNFATPPATTQSFKVVIVG